MTALYDIGVYTRKKRLVLAVDVMGGKEPTSHDAAGFRRNLIAHELFPDTPFFLLAHRTRLFLWRQETAAEQLADFSAPTAAFLNDYAASASLPDPANTLRKSALRLVMFAWLGDLVSGLRKPECTSEPDSMLVESGIYEQIHRGDIDLEEEDT